MNCCDARSSLPLLLDGQLAARDRAAAIDKVMACRVCRAELTALSQNDAALRRVLGAQTAAVPAGYFDDFWPRLSARLDERVEEGEAMRTSSGASSKPVGLPPADDVVGKPIVQEESSGLHEIKALAASAVARHSKERRAETDPGDDADAIIATAAATSGSFGQVVLPQPGKEVAPPVVRATSVSDADGVRAPTLQVPAKSSRTGLVVGVVGILAAAAAFALYLGKGKEAAAPQAAATPPTEVAPAPATEPTVAAVPTPPPAPTVAELTPPADAPKAEEPKAVASAAEPKAKAAEKGSEKPADKTEKADKAEKKDAKVAAAPAAPAAEPAKPAAPKNEIDDLFGDSKPTEAAKPAAAGPALPEKLEQADVKKGMGTVKARVQACYDEFKVPGTIKLKVKIEADGAVSSADVTDEKFKGTETGACVSAAVKTAKFPAVSGTSLVVTYPFILQ